jgi:hypothetical protein
MLTPGAGFGVHDALKDILRIPAEREDWELWVQGNPLKIMRYFQLKVEGYKPLDSETHDFLCAAALSELKDIPAQTLRRHVLYALFALSLSRHCGVGADQP